MNITHHKNGEIKIIQQENKMNAYELADYMENKEFRIPNHNEIKAATMLRQQADRIAELEKFTKAILKKGGCDGNICKRYDTHPVKQLSDEEIWEVINRTAWVGTEEEIRFKIANAIIKEITE